MGEKHLHILWTNADPTTAKLMVMMYATNSMKNKWWDQVTVIIWGATAGLVAENEEIQQHMKHAQSMGVKFTACLACAKELNVGSKLVELDVEVKYWGAPLTELMQNNQPLLTV